MKSGRSALIALALACAACGRGPIEVDHPFYLHHFEDPDQVALVRCPDGPDGGCALDGLPGPIIVAAGADERFVAVQSNRGYYYFARVPQEVRGWGSNPERIVGPLDDEEYAAAKARLGLPDLTVRP
jgi:hypothetical protein